MLFLLVRNASVTVKKQLGQLGGYEDDWCFGTVLLFEATLILLEGKCNCESRPGVGIGHPPLPPARMPPG